jgi:hypothetical protein
MATITASKNALPWLQVKIIGSFVGTFSKPRINNLLK